MAAETLLTNRNSSQILAATKAISDETRIRILHILSFGAFSVNEVVEILEMGQSRISRHLKILTEAGLIGSRREGSLVYSFLPDEESFGLKFPMELTKLLLSYKEDLPNREKDQKMVHLILEAREKKSKSFFDGVAESWEKLQEETLHPKLYRSWILQELPICENILDLGCGPGGLIPFLLNKAKHVTGVDNSSRMIENASIHFAKNPSVSLIQTPMEHLPLQANSCDAVVASMVMHHISHPPTVLEEIARVLKPGGVLCVVDLEKHNAEYMRDNFADLWLGFEPELFESWLSNAGFNVKSIGEIQTESSFKILTIKATKE
ncbi:MAG: ArsR/SmtB family transcription factor [Leptospira bouyouniensis]|uniref:Methyltransferase domain-containing protein n=1 Tax=Leptospira bouyouniensis TaxID=2484911 RepID=A0A7I0IV19_9LEPT|nr:metalloregulator ArsR/SmtB family transcription factor [Leptospira bouyouniensis]TGK49774.1 methyltransferase domain-containing protein [Leptospira bouyouniensis]TGL09475.1 methyltransferase domain-containing protein [Leptospira bouyouniensis]TGM77959.1 methyltransferase domain-containing protein [Leptospira bouyouniensis]